MANFHVHELSGPEHGIPSKSGQKDPVSVSIAQPLYAVRTDAPSTRRRLSARSWSQPPDATMDKPSGREHEPTPLVFLEHPKEWKGPLASGISGQCVLNRNLPNFGNGKVHRTRLSWSPSSDDEEETSPEVQLYQSGSTTLSTSQIPRYRIRSQRVLNVIATGEKVPNLKKAKSDSKGVECESTHTLIQEIVFDSFKEFHSPGSGNMVVRLQPEDPTFKHFLTTVDKCLSVPSSQSATISILSSVRFVDENGAILTPGSAYSFVEATLQARMSKGIRKRTIVSQKVVGTQPQGATEQPQRRRNSGTCNAAFRKEVRCSKLEYDRGDEVAKRSVVTSIIDRFQFRSKDDTSVMTGTAVFNLVEKTFSQSSRKSDARGAYRQALLDNEQEYRCGDEATKHSLVTGILSRFQLTKENVLLTVSEQYHEVENALIGDLEEETVQKLRNSSHRQNQLQSTALEATAEFEASKKVEGILNLLPEGKHRKRKLRVPDSSDETWKERRSDLDPEARR